MKKQSKNSGLTVPCPNCKNDLAFKANYTGEGNEEVYCRHCKTFFIRTIKQKAVITFSKIIKTMVIVAILAIITFTQIFKFNAVQKADNASIR